MTEKIPAIPDINAQDTANVQEVLVVIKEILEIMLGRRGTNEDLQVLFNDDLDTLNTLITGLAGLVLIDTGNDHTLTLKLNENLSADKVLNIVVNDATRTITFSGNPTLADWFDQAVKVASSPIFQGVTSTILKILDTGGDHSLRIKPNEDLGADRILNIIVSDGDKTITLTGNPTLADWFNQAVKTTSIPTLLGLILGSGGLDMSGYYAVNMQNIPDLDSKGAGYYLTGVGQYVEVADNPNLDQGTNDFSVEISVKPNNVTDTGKRLVSKTDGTTGFEIVINEDDLQVAVLDNANNVTLTNLATGIFTKDVHTSVVVTFDRSGNILAYVNGDGAGFVACTATADISNAGVLRIGTETGGVTQEFAGEVRKVRMHNFLLSATDVKAFASGAPIPFKYLGATQTEMITDSDNQDFADGTINEWVAITDGGGTCVYAAGPGAVKTGLVTSGATVPGNHGGQLPTGNLTAFEAGRQYIIEADIYLPAGNNNWFSVGAFVDSMDISDFDIDGVNTDTEDAWQHIQTVFTAGDDVTGAIKIHGFTFTQGDLFYFDNISVRKAGCVLQLEQDGIGYSEWVDKSGNDAVVTVVGADPVNLPKNPTFIGALLTDDLVLPKTAGKGIKVEPAAPTFGWRDLKGKVTQRNTGGSKPTHATYRDSLAQYRFAAGKEEYFTYHIDHDHVPDSDIFLHVHWSNIGEFANGGTVTFEYELSYAKGFNRGAFGASVSTTFPGDAGTQYDHIITEIQVSAVSPNGNQLDSNDLEPDGVIEARIKVTSVDITVSEGGGAGDPFIHEVDIHYQSTGMGTKQKAPDFYV